MSEFEKLEQIGRAMQAAWSRIKQSQARMWGDWMTIGEGLLEGRRRAMQRAGTNRPEGKGYVTYYSEWLERYKVDDMEKSDRAKLLQLMEDRAGVEQWRATLTDHERRSLNNPVVVWRKWTGATRVKKPKPRSANVSGTEYTRARAKVEELQARNAELEEELKNACERNKELEAQLKTKARFADLADKEKKQWAKECPAVKNYKDHDTWLRHRDEKNYGKMRVDTLGRGLPNEERTLWNNIITMRRKAEQAEHIPEATTCWKFYKKSLEQAKTTYRYIDPEVIYEFPDLGLEEFD